LNPLITLVRQCLNQHNCLTFNWEKKKQFFDKKKLTYSIYAYFFYDYVSSYLYSSHKKHLKLKQMDASKLPIDIQVAKLLSNLKRILKKCASNL
jgi:hypothetical protein